MVNRLGNTSSPAPQAVDRTRIFIAQVMLRRPKIQHFEFLPDGNIRFSLSLAGTAIAGRRLGGARLLRTHWFANSVGEFLVRVNLAQLDAVVDHADYAALAAAGRYRGFEFWIQPDQLQFQFHCGLLNRIFNEELRRELRGVQRDLHQHVHKENNVLFPRAIERQG